MSEKGQDTLTKTLREDVEGFTRLDSAKLQSNLPQQVRTCCDGHTSRQQPIDTVHNVDLEITDSELPNHDSEAAKRSSNACVHADDSREFNSLPHLYRRSIEREEAHKQ
jgi:hypothetical protein